MNNTEDENDDDEDDEDDALPSPTSNHTLGYTA